MNGGNTGVYGKNSASSTTNPHENSSTTGVYHSKGNVSSELLERCEFMWFEEISSISPDHGLSLKTKTV